MTHTLLGITNTYAHTHNFIQFLTLYSKFYNSNVCGHTWYSMFVEVRGKLLKLLELVQTHVSGLGSKCLYSLSHFTRLQRFESIL